MSFIDRINFHYRYVISSRECNYILEIVLKWIIDVALIHISVKYILLLFHHLLFINDVGLIYYSVFRNYPIWIFKFITLRLSNVFKNFHIWYLYIVGDTVSICSFFHLKYETVEEEVKTKNKFFV